MAAGRSSRSEKLISDILSQIEARAPMGTAESWDNVGLLAGDSSWKTRGAVVSVDLTREAIETAVAKKFRLIFTHHPCIFPKQRGLAKVTAPSLVFEAIRAGVAVAAHHTNFDRCALEVVDKVSQGLGVTPKGRLIDHPTESLMKLVVFVPKTHVNAVRLALADADAGGVGNYDTCTFGVEGEGRFRGRDGTHPFLGKPGQLESVQEVRLETIFPRGIEKRVISKLLEAHPYEEVAYDLYSLEQAALPHGLAFGLGYGFWGDLHKPLTLRELGKKVQNLFQIPGLLLTEAQTRGSKKAAANKVKRVGFVAGKGSSFLSAASAVGCDVFITGEAGYHDALGSRRRGMSVMELGHRESERFFILTMSEWARASGIEAVALHQPEQRMVFIK